MDSDDAISVRMVKALLDAGSDGNRLPVSSVVRFEDVLPQEEQAHYSAECCGKNTAARRGGFYCYGALHSREIICRENLRFDMALGNLEDVVWNGAYLRYVSDVVFVNVPYYYRMTPDSITSKCSDYRWQITSWLKARKSMMNWFAERPLTEPQKKEAAQMFRHCQNNIYAECVAGKVSFSAFYAMEKEEKVRFDQKLVTVPEKMAMNCLPWLYYGLYTMLIRMKNHLRQRNK